MSFRSEELEEHLHKIRDLCQMEPGLHFANKSLAAEMEEFQRLVVVVRGAQVVVVRLGV